MEQRRSLIVFIAIAVMPIFGFGQDKSTSNESTEKEKKISYAFSYESGFYVGKFFDWGFTKGITGVFVNGIRFNKTQNEIGFGIGYDILNIDYESIMFFPVYFNYRHYFSSKGKVKPLINVGIGTQFYFDERYGRNPKIECISGLYSTVAAGFNVKYFTFTAGLFIKSCEWNYDFGDYNAGVEIKAGFTF